MADDNKVVLTEIGSQGLSVSSGVITEDDLQDLRYPNNRTTYKKMWLDPSIQSVMSAIRAFMRGVDYDVEVDAETPTSVQEDQINLIKTCMGDMDVSFQTLMNETLSKLKYGFTVQEKVWKYRNQTGRYKSKYNDGRIGWAKLPIRSQDTISEWEFDKYGREVVSVIQDLNLVDSNYNRVGNFVQGVGNKRKIPRKRFLLISHNQERGNPEGNSALKACYIPWKYKSQIEEFQAAGISRDLGGLPVIQIPPEYLSEDADADKKAVYEQCKQIILNLQANQQAGIIFPKYVDPETKQDMFTFELKSVDGGKMYDTTAIINSYENKILMTFLADVLKLGQDASGSFALSDNKTNLLGVGIRSIIEETLEAFNQDLVIQTLEINGHNDLTDPPRIVMGDLDEKDLDNLGKLIQRAVSVGAMEADQDLSDWLRKQIGAPKVNREKPVDEKMLPSAASKASQGMKTAGEGTATGVKGNGDSSSSNKENA